MDRLRKYNLISQNFATKSNGIPFIETEYESDRKGRFTSSSTEEYVADNFRYIGKGDIIWSIKAKPGTDIKAINAAEKEVLLRMNTTYKLKSITPCWRERLAGVHKNKK